jgi:hypothetical protein
MVIVDAGILEDHDISKLTTRRVSEMDHARPRTLLGSSLVDGRMIWLQRAASGWAAVVGHTGLACWNSRFESVMRYFFFLDREADCRQAQVYKLISGGSLFYFYC